jgi:hypothetical protein
MNSLSLRLWATAEPAVPMTNGALTESWLLPNEESVTRAE